MEGLTYLTHQRDCNVCSLAAGPLRFCDASLFDQHLEQRLADIAAVLIRYLDVDAITGHELGVLSPAYEWPFEPKLTESLYEIPPFSLLRERTHAL